MKIITITLQRTSSEHKKKLHHSPVHNSSILENCDCRQSFTHDNISCRDKLSVVTLVEYTFTAISAHSLMMIVVAHEVVMIIGMVDDFSERSDERRKKKHKKEKLMTNIIINIINICVKISRVHDTHLEAFL